MASVDNKVVSIKFDNESFQQKMAETVKSLDKLRNSLDFASSQRGLTELSTASDNFQMTNVGKAADGVSGKFVAMAAVAITALTNIVNRAVDAGIQIVKAFSITPVIEGFGEFELKMGSIQTIMAGSGAGLSTVNAKLSELNDYADRTIYSFSDMTQNIGKFTNAGVSLDDSVAAIQGVANVAALSGANSNEAARSMYNFAQAISSGSVKLIDWKSIELANMGTVEFKQQLIDTGVAMGTLTKTTDGYVTSAGTTFDATKNFNQSLTDQWLTSEALTETLGRYSDTTTDIGKRATAAAQDVKTFSHMIDTMKESAGSGWAETFELVIGDFEEGKKLWTGINNVFGGMIEESANARNEILRGWKVFGGRDTVLQGLKNAFEGIRSILAPIKEAFREIFPKKTAADLIELSNRFEAFTEKLKIGAGTADQIKRIFSGFFSIFKIGVEIVKGIVGAFATVAAGLAGEGGGIVDFFVKISDGLVALRKALVDGGGIAAFFQKIAGYVTPAAKAIGAFISIIARFAGSLSIFGGKGASSGFAEVGNQLDNVSSAATKLGGVWQDLLGRMSKIGDAFKKFGEGIKDVFITIRDHLQNGFQDKDIDGILSAINVGLLGGIIVLIKKFLTGGLKLDIGGGFLGKLDTAFESLTDTLGAMQAQLKSQAIINIAIAVGILVASMIVLSFIDASALTKALAAISVGFIQLIGAFTAMEKLQIGTGAAKIAMLMTGMVAMAASMVILATAVKMLSSLEWEELAKGLTGIGAMFVVMTTGMKLMSENTRGLIKGAFAMIGMAIALIILSKAVKEFAEMDWPTLARGLTGVAGGLLIIAGAMRLMPKPYGMIKQAAAIVIISGAMLILASAVQKMGGIPWDVMGRGFVGVGAGLLIIAGAMHLMPKNMPFIAVGLIGIGIALNLMSIAVARFGNMDLGTLAQGIGAIGAMLVILAAGAHAMSGAVAGAVGIVIVSASLVLLAEVIRTLGNMDIWTMIQGIAGVAAVLVVLGIAAALMTPVIPSLFGLGVALSALGVAIYLFGAGAKMFAQSFAIMAKAGDKGAKAVVNTMKIIVKALPEILQGFAIAITDFLYALLESLGPIIEELGNVLLTLIEEIKELVGPLAEVIGSIITRSVELLREKFPELVDVIFEMITTLLTAVRDNIYQFTELAVEIIIKFAEALTANAQPLTDAAVNLVIAFLGAISARIPDLVAAGVEILVQFIYGVTSSVDRIIGAVTMLIVVFIYAVAGMYVQIAKAGTDALVQFIRGMTDNIDRIITAVTILIVTFILAVGGMAVQIARAGTDALVQFIRGMTDNIDRIITAGTDLIVKFIQGMGKAGGQIVTAAGNAIIAFILGVGKMANRVVTAGVDTILEFLRGLSGNAQRLLNGAMDVMFDFLEGLKESIKKYSKKFREIGRDIAYEIADGLSGGLMSKIGDVKDGAVGLVEGGWRAGKSFLGIGGPSKLFCQLGKDSALGLANGLREDNSVAQSASMLANDVATSFQKGISKLSLSLSDIDDVPTIRPVLDLTDVESEAGRLGGILMANAITPELGYATESYRKARALSHTTDAKDETVPTPTPAPTEVTFEQNIYSPEALSTSDIYRSTKSQIALAKEELNI